MTNDLRRVKIKLIKAFAVAVLMACVLFGLIDCIGTDVVTIYLDVIHYVYAKELPYIEKFQKFVTDNNISTSDVQAYDEWMAEHNVSFYSIQKEGKVIYNKSNVDTFMVKAKDMYDYRMTGSYQVTVVFEDTEAEVFIYAGFIEKYYRGFVILDVGFSICIGMLFAFMHIRKIISSYQLELENSQALEKKVREEKDELMRNMAHDLRTPLTGIMTYIDVMKLENKSNSQNIEYLNLLGDKLINIREQIDNMLDFSMASSEGKIELDSSMDVEYTIGDYLSDMYAELINSGYEVNVDGVKWKNIKVAINIGLLSRIFTNLTDNIYKYADTNKSVVMRTVFKNKSIEVEIDNGICDDKTLRESTGIGLKSVDMMMQRMNGQMSYSRDNKIFRVKLEFPIVK